MEVRKKLNLNCPGVYRWRNTVNDKVYIGSTINLRRRKAEHILRLGKGDESNEYFQRAWSKYGADKFEFTILERCRADNRLECEQRWIDKFHSMDERFGYNLIPTRESQLYGAALSKHQKKGWAKYTKEERKQLNLHLNNPVAKQKALARSNEVKKLQPWRDAMESTWQKLSEKWQDPVQRAKILAAQNAGRARAKKRRELEKVKPKSWRKWINDEIVRTAVK